VGCGFRDGSGKIVSQNKHRGEVLTLNRPFLCLQRDSDETGNVIRCLLLSKLKLGLELKQKYPPKPQITNNSYPTFLERLNIYFFRDRGIREYVVARL